MGVWDAITEIFEAAAPWGEAQAEAPAEEPQTQVGMIYGPEEMGRMGDRVNWGRCGLIGPGPPARDPELGCFVMGPEV